LAGNYATATLNLLFAETFLPAAMATTEVKTKAFLAMFKCETKYL